MAHLYASFADAALAEKAAGALLDYGVRKEDVSIVANDAYGHSRATTGTSAADAGRGAANLGDSVVDGTKSVGDRIQQGGDKAAGAVAGAFGADRAAANYEAGADRQAVQAEGRSAMAGSESDVHGRPTGTGSAAVADDTGSTESAAKHGISTTTPEDADEGAVKGAGIGLGVGVAAALASLLVPGVGFVIGGGALASAIGGAALAAGAGAVAGGVTGYLKEQGVPGDAAQRYHGTVEGGGAVLSVSLPSGDVDQATAETVLSKYGASDVNSY